MNIIIKIVPFMLILLAHKMPFYNFYISTALTLWGLICVIALVAYCVNANKNAKESLKAWRVFLNTAFYVIILICFANMGWKTCFVIYLIQLTIYILILIAAIGESEEHQNDN